MPNFMRNILFRKLYGLKNDIMGLLLGKINQKIDRRLIYMRCKNYVNVYVEYLVWWLIESWWIFISPLILQHFIWLQYSLPKCAIKTKSIDDLLYFSCLTYTTTSLETHRINLMLHWKVDWMDVESGEKNFKSFFKETSKQCSRRFTTAKVF